jgi:ABC-type phosphate transport system substrate-binding protein
MKRSIRYLSGTIVAFALSSFAKFAMAETVIIVAATNPVTTLTSDQAADLFLGRASSFPSGGTATPIDQTDGSSVREDFYAKVASKSGAQVKAYWAKLVFTGKEAKPPMDAGDSAGVKRAVAANPGAVGYVDKSVVDGSVKVVLSLH